MGAIVNNTPSVQPIKKLVTHSRPSKVISYRGQRLHGKRHGKGILNNEVSESSYIGEWDNDIPNGVGYIVVTNTKKVFKNVMIKNGKFTLLLGVITGNKTMHDVFAWNVDHQYFEFYGCEMN